MEKLRIEGGVPLVGEVQASGAKNAITKLLVASLFSDKPCTFYNVPDIGDVRVTVELCQEIGMQVDWDKKSGILHCQTKEIATSYIPQRFSGSNRISDPHDRRPPWKDRRGRYRPHRWGVSIGRRSVDFHVDALTKLGACIEHREMKRESAYFAHAHNGLRGTMIRLPYPSVGATENTILAAVSARGTTILQNAAIEPEIMELILFLQKIGAQISVEADRSIRIVGTRVFYETDHTILADRIEAASLGMAAIGPREESSFGEPSITR